MSTYSILSWETLYYRNVEKFIFSPPPPRILFLGLDAVGKTTMLYKLKLNEYVSTVSMCGFNAEHIQLTKNVSFVIWDVGGGAKIFPLWRHYFAGA